VAADGLATVVAERAETLFVGAGESDDGVSTFCEVLDLT
jgi:hypothetical protein